MKKITLFLSAMLFSVMSFAETATISFADKAQRTSLSETQQVWEQNGLVVTNDKATSTSNVADYANPARFYKGSSLTIECTLGNITKIEVTCNTAAYATALQTSVGAEATAAEKIVTIVPSAESATYVVEALTAQVRVNELTVTYGEGGETPDTPDTPDTPFEGKTFAFTALEGKIGAQTCGMATFSAMVPTMVPAGVTAYYVRKADESIVTLTRISRSMAIPANEGVILMAGSAGDYVMTEVEDGTSVAELTGNLLVGTCDKESTTLKSTDYVLALKGSGTLAGQFAFCLVGDMTVTQPANRAYLQMESGASQVRMMFDGNETSVNDVLATPQGSAEYYDLTGRRVKKPAKGVYIVKGQIIVEE